MTIFEEIKEGDRIVVKEQSGWWGRDERLFKIVTVTKVTATQITAGGVRFLRHSGYQFGKEIRDAARIADNERFGKDKRLMTPEEAEAKNKELRKVLNHKALARRIKDTDFSKLPYETLLKLAEVLGMEAPDDNP